MLNKRFAFTLAEVLITIGIIGVVAAMTLPTLRMNIEGKILSTKAKHAYALFTQAAKTYMGQNGLLSLKSVRDCSVSTCTDKTPSVEKLVETTLKVVQKCDNPADCFTESYVTKGGTELTSDVIASSGHAYILADGYVILISRPSPSSMIKLKVDVNGSEPPNEFGSDIWALRINNEGMVVSGGGGGSCDQNYNACFSEFLESKSVND